MDPSCKFIVSDPDERKDLISQVTAMNNASNGESRMGKTFSTIITKPLDSVSRKSIGTIKPLSDQGRKKKKSRRVHIQLQLLWRMLD